MPGDGGVPVKLHPTKWLLIIHGHDGKETKRDGSCGTEGVEASYRRS